MNKYINADDIISKIMAKCDNNPWILLTESDTDLYHIVANKKALATIIHEMPSADVAEVKYGHWIEEEYSIEDDWGINNYHYHICSECHEKISNTDFSKSWICCPYCGAVMRGEIE